MSIFTDNPSQAGYHSEMHDRFAAYTFNQRKVGVGVGGRWLDRLNLSLNKGFD